MKVFIVEDEPLARNNLSRTLLENFPDVHIVGFASSVKDTVAWLENPSNEADVIFMDVELSDGKCFEIFRKVKVEARVMTTAYDSYAMKAFEVNSVDYLLKPVELSSLKRAMDRCRESGGRLDVEKLLSALSPKREASSFKERFLVYINDRIVPIRIHDVAFLFSESKDNHVATKDGTVYVIDSSLDSLATEIDPDLFFRISRSCIVAKDSVEIVTKLLGGRLQVKIRGLDRNSSVLKTYSPDLSVSRSRADEFLNWLEK